MFGLAAAFTTGCTRRSSPGPQRSLPPQVGAKPEAVASDSAHGAVALQAQAAPGGGDAGAPAPATPLSRWGKLRPNLRCLLLGAGLCSVITLAVVAAMHVGILIWGIRLGGGWCVSAAIIVGVTWGAAAVLLALLVVGVWRRHGEAHHFPIGVLFPAAVFWVGWGVTVFAFLIYLVAYALRDWPTTT